MDGGAKIKEINKVLKGINNASKDVQDVVADNMKNTALFMEDRAVSYAPAVEGILRNSIFSRQGKDKYTYEIGADLKIAPYAPYVEFGTGDKVDVPDELSDIASQFKAGKRKTGTFEEGLASIKKWCKSKGIPEEKAFIIFMKILKVGISPQPFLYPALVEGREELKKTLLADYKNIVKK
jgi:HK97 gp10 family phage protein